MKAHTGPPRFSKYDNRYGPPPQILLIAHVLVRCEKDSVPGLFGACDQFAIVELMPTDLSGTSDFVSGQAIRDLLWDAVVKQNLHPGISAVRGFLLKALVYEVQYGSNFVCSDVEHLRDFVDGQARLEIFDDGLHRHARTA